MKKTLWSWLRKFDAKAYRIYTTEFDLICTGEDLTHFLSSEEHEKWTNASSSYEREVAGYREAATADFAAVFERSLSGTSFDPKDTAVSLLIDHSGSMKGRGAVTACLAAEILGDFLGAIGVTYEVLGFTTRTWKGGQSRNKWIAEGRQFLPGRLADTLQIIYRDGMTATTKVPPTVRHLLRESLLKENIDGEAVLWARQRLKALQKTRNLIVVISDGAPVDDSTLHSNQPTILLDHLKSVLADLRKSKEVQVVGIGIGHDLSALYPECVKIESVAGSAQILLPFVANLIVGQD